MARLLDLQKKKGGAAQGGVDKAAARQEPLSEGRAEATVQAKPIPVAPAAANTPAPVEVPPSLAIEAPETPAPQAAVPVSVPPTGAAPSSAPASAPQGAPHVIDEQVLMTLPDEAFVNFSRSRFDSLKLVSPQDILLAAIDHPEIAAIIRAAKQRNALQLLFSSEAQKPPSRNTANSGQHPGEVSADGPTMASNVSPGMVASHPPAGTKRPPPLPPRRKVSEPPPASEATQNLPLSEMGAFIQELKNSGDLTKDRYDRAVAFFQSKRDEALKTYGKEALNQAALTAKQKQQSESWHPSDLTPQERFMLDLGELNKLIGWLKKRMVAEQPAQDAINAQGKNGVDKPASPSVPPQAPAPASAASASEQKAPASAQAVEPAAPAQRPGVPPSAKPKAGVVGRFFSNYTTWSVIGIGAFTGALIYTDQFRDLAKGAKNIYEYLSGRQISSIPNAWIIGIYSAVMVSVVIIGTLITRARAQRMAQRARIRSERSDADMAKIEFVLKKLSQIMLNQVKAEDQISQIRQELRSDEAFFAAMYFLRKDSVFDDILEEARVSEKLRGMIRSVLLPRTELEIMQRKLKRFADIVYKPRDRANLFRNMYEDEDHVAFRLISDELLGDPLNNLRARDVFSYVENNKGVNVGEPLLKGLQQDYDDIISTKI
ncbi:MAG: hypothetical protein V1861_05705 [Candidatus Micrarchaeota archaeon]